MIELSMTRSTEKMVQLVVFHFWLGEVHFDFPIRLCIFTAVLGSDLWFRK